MKIHQWFTEVIVLSAATILLCLSKPTERKSQLLPPSLSPEHYEISLDPRLDKGIFQGLVVISGLALSNTDKIVLHCKSLVFNNTILTDLSRQETIGITSIEEDVVLQRCLLLLNQSLTTNNEYRLSIEFMGIIGKDGVGLYKDFYMENGVKHEMLMTHFQPNYARAMFPCFDEPHYKAQFQLRVTRQKFPTVISNMPVSTSARLDLLSSEEDSQRWVEFEDTPLMSPYLLVLVMCDYISLTDSTTNSSVWAPPSRLHEAQLALNVSVAVLDQCERYFGVDHAIPKLDHVPVTLLGTVAMENWGAITYKRDFLLWEEGVSTWSQKETTSFVICHETIHQWIGNLVTTSWWNTTWLNEGIATYYQFYIMDKIEPTWNVMDNTFVTQVQQIFNEESMRDPKPLTNNEVFTQTSIAFEAFSATTYLKGAAVMRMVASIMPEDIFREAIVQYILDNEYSTVDEEDLWQSLAVVSDLPVDLESVMYGWTHQPGFPLVTVIRDNEGCVSVKQNKYLASDESDVRWTIPLTFTTSNDRNFNSFKTLWFPDDEERLKLGVCLKQDEWILLNLKQSGYYMVQYDLVTWGALTHHLMTGDVSQVHSVSRAQLLHGGFDLAVHGQLEYPEVLRLSRYLRREMEYLPWFTFIQWFNSLKARLYKTEAQELFQRYALDLVENVFKSMSLRGDAGGMIQELHRKQIVEFACGLGHPYCVKEATETTYLLMSGVQVNMPLELKPVMLCAAVKHGQDEVWHYVLKEYHSAKENERWKYLFALSCTSKKKTIERLLKDVADPSSFVKSNDERINLLMELGKQDDALEPVLDMMLGGYQSLTANFDFEMILSIIKNVFPTRLPTTQEKLKLHKIASLVSTTQSPRQSDLMESIIADFNKSKFNNRYIVAITKWLKNELNLNETIVESTTSSLPSQERPTPSMMEEKKSKEIVNTNEELSSIDENNVLVSKKDSSGAQFLPLNIVICFVLFFVTVMR